MKLEREIEDQMIEDDKTEETMLNGIPSVTVMIITSNFNCGKGSLNP